MDMKDTTMYIDSLPMQLQMLLYPYKGACPHDLTSAEIIEYAEESITNFSELLCLKGEGIRVDECQMYLMVWNHIKAMDGAWDRLNVYQRGQVMDCYYDERGDGIEDGDHSEDTDVIPF